MISATHGGKNRVEEKSYFPEMASFLISFDLAFAEAARFCCSSNALALVAASASAAASHTTNLISKFLIIQAMLATVLVFFDFEYSFSLTTKLSKSCCFCSRFARERFWSSGLYRCSAVSVLP